MFVLLKVQSLQLSFRPAGVSLGGVGWGGGGGYAPALGQAPPSLMLILAVREIQYITPLKIRSRKFDVVP